MLNMPDTFNGFLISMLTCDHGNEININASPKQILKKVIAFMAKTDFGISYLGKQVTLIAQWKSFASSSIVEAQLNAHDVVLLMSNSFLNIHLEFQLTHIRRYVIMQNYQRIFEGQSGSSAYSFDPSSTEI